MDNLTLPYGIYRGKSLEWVMKKDPSYLKFIYRKSGYDGEIKTWIWDHMTEIETLIKAK